MDVTALGLVLMLSGPDGAAVFNWPEIKTCAARPIPSFQPPADGTTGMLSPEWLAYQVAFKTIIFCRNVLAARHDGWTAAAPDKPDPLLPEPMVRPDDLK